MRKTLFLIAFTIIFSSFALADVRLPETPKPKSAKAIDTGLIIRIDKDAKEARLIIPKTQIKQLRAQLAEMDSEPDTNASLNTGFSRTQTIISGMFMSLAFLFGGVWFVRSRKISTTAGKATIAGAVLFLAASVASIAYANAGPPPEARSITGKMFSSSVHMYKFGSGRIKLETATDNATDVKLIVPDIKDDKPDREE